MWYILYETKVSNILECCAPLCIFRLRGKEQSPTPSYKQIIKQAKKEIVGIEMRDGITISNKGIKEWINQPHKHYTEKIKALLRLPEVLDSSKYIGYGVDKHDPRVKAHLYETIIGGDRSWIVVREFKDKISYCIASAIALTSSK